MEIKKQHVEGQHYLGKTAKIKISEIMHNSIFKDTYGALGAYIHEKGIIPTGAPVAIYKSWHPEEDYTDLMPAFAVNADVEVGDFELFEVPASEAYVGIHNGSYAGLKEAHEAIMKKMEEEGAIPKLTVEEYTVGPKMDDNGMDDSKCVSTLYYFV